LVAQVRATMLQFFFPGFLLADRQLHGESGPVTESTHSRVLTVSESEASTATRHSAVVRITHWITTLSFFALALSGITILLAQPRLYWGETGARGGPSLIDLPLPFVLDVPMRGPGRYVHFLFAWISVFTGFVYIVDGLLTRHFSRHLLPARPQLNGKQIHRVIWDHLRLKRPAEEEALTYNLLQRITYLLVIFVAFPLMVWTGLAMSPAITSVIPGTVTSFGGQQSARTIHFFVACFLVLFFFIHVAMVGLAGFTRRVRAMITGHAAVTKERI
jgi:thiosulfate reductase cytochrome b subunit